ncbi:MAG: tRNA preQ1(34) S-adenosylmethionine ribosyltransferase-isomerase QueA [Halofilum sp. (in: g-proteobacteria)]|nr:tRNA preQ1(34) S-adenosylmethionine ribosyltransferase-isomerase QueA [Halofilum sp. (in: g-proteobacteria)]
MRVADFQYDLPDEQIAQYPLGERSASRLLVVDGGRDARSDRVFRELPSLLEPGDLLVFNDTRVFPARLHGRKRDTGGRIEVLIERLHEDGRGALAQVRASKSPRQGAVLELADGALAATVTGRRDDLFLLDFGPGEPLLQRLERCGEVPLPPYIERAPEDADSERYQTVYARQPGAVAAPTAGLHFDESVFAALDARGVERTTVTLHVGAGTFRPVRADRVEEHVMHAETVEVPPAACEAIAAARARGGRVVAVGTTVVRSLESAVDEQGTVRPFTGETRLFLVPGSVFRAVDGLVTNFHLPGSTLLMLVCAFGGHERMLAAYRHAVAAGYRFFSYGDAMLIWPDPAAVAA